jgi:hypothetical protein
MVRREPPKKDVDATLGAIKQAELARTDVEFQTLVVEDVGQLKSDQAMLVQEIARMYFKQADPRFLRGSTTELLADNVRRQINNEALRANIFTGVFNGIPLSRKTNKLLYGTADKISALTNTLDQASNEYRKEGLKIAGPAPAPMPTPDQLDRMNKLAEAYLDKALPLLEQMPPLAGDLQQGFNDALGEISRRAAWYHLISSVLGWFYVLCFVAGSVLSLVGTFFRSPHKDSAAV